MNYEKMWKSFKKVIEEETKILSEEAKKSTTGKLADELEAQYNEADFLAGEMEAIEGLELLLQEKEKSEVKNRCQSF